MKNTSRVESLDTLRSVLTIAMIFYHFVLNLGGHFFGLETYFLWVPAGFIFVSGVLASRLLGRKSDGYFFVRGLKMIFLFLGLNLHVFLGEVVRLRDLLLGRTEQFSFEILAPIGLLLLGVPFLRRLPAGWAPFYAVVLYFGHLWLGAHVEELYSYNLDLWYVGAFGFFFGRIFGGCVELYSGFVKLFFAVLSFVFSGLIFYFWQHFLLAGVALVFGLYWLSFFFKNPLAMGRNSLFVYVLHILLIVGLLRLGLRGFLGVSWGFYLSLVVFVGLMEGVARLVEVLLERNGGFRRLYRWFF